MPGLTQQSADVRFQEIDLSQTLANRSTANGAIVLVSKQGRLNRFNTTTWADFVAEYGERNASVSFGHYCAKDFFDEGNSLDVVRVVGTGYAYSGALVKDDGTGITSVAAIGSGIVDPTAIPFASYVTGGALPLFAVYPKNGPGSYANSLAISLVSENIATPAAPTLVSTNSGGSLTAGTFQYRISALSAIGETLASTLATVTIAGPTSIAQVALTWALVPGARGYKIYGNSNVGEGLMATVGANTNTWTDTGAVTPDTTHLPITIPGNLPAPSTQFTLNVFDTTQSSTVPQETWLCTLTDFTDDNGVQLEVGQQVTNFSQYVNVVSNVSALVGTIPTIKATNQQALTGGTSGAAPTNSQIAQAWTNAFSDAEHVKVNILINAGYTDVNVQQTMLQVAAARGDAVAVLDTPSSMQNYQDAITYRQLILNANTSYGALYSSDVYVSDNYNGKQLFTPCSGRVAAIYARTDRVAGPQYAPAGLNRGLIDVLGLRVEYNDSQRTQLFNAQVNYIRTFVGAGTAVFEQVTLQNKKSALSWVAVRRMINTIEGGVKDYLMYSLHEPNDDFLRRQIVTALTDYLQSWKDARGLLDFEVVSDATNNPPAKYNLGILTVTVFITPVIAVHEIGVQIVITKAGVSFSTINISALG